ncbi:MAG: DUF4065 domain-containing protein [Mycoplasmataceae bacterium]|jgi:uncharacterized phage-associated protein|nr:DUF4065 domain-containing protein [Mycoplasmataceae bacterium]
MEKIENLCYHILSKIPKNRRAQLFLNKYLFFTYGYYYSATGNEPFPANFYAWKYGPVEMNIYHNFLLEPNKNMTSVHSVILI